MNLTQYIKVHATIKYFFVITHVQYYFHSLLQQRPCIRMMKTLTQQDDFPKLRTFYDITAFIGRFVSLSCLFPLLYTYHKRLCFSAPPSYPLPPLRLHLRIGLYLLLHLVTRKLIHALQYQPSETM